MGRKSQAWMTGLEKEDRVTIAVQRQKEMEPELIRAAASIVKKKKRGCQLKIDFFF